MQQLFGQPVQLDAGLQLRLGRGLLLDLVEGVEDAPLHASARPVLLPGLLEAAAAVGHHDVGRGYLGHEGSPRPRVLGPGHVPADDELLRGCDQDHDVAREVDAVDEHDAVHFACYWRYGPNLPEPGALAPEGAAAAGHVGLPPAREQPSEEGRQQLGRIVDSPRRRRLAFRALPSLRARLRLAVLDHVPAADGALLPAHSPLVSPGCITSN